MNERWVQDEDEAVGGRGVGRWERRAARREAERQRMPKHGKAYTEVAQRMLARRATEVAGEAAGDAEASRADAPTRRTAAAADTALALQRRTAQRLREGTASPAAPRRPSR